MNLWNISFGEDFLSDEVAVGSTPTPTEIRRDGKPFLADSWTATHDAGYICSKDQRVFQVTTERATEMVAPGHAKASPQTAIGTFLPASGAKGCFAMKRKNGRFWPRRPIRVGRENIGLTCPTNWPWRSTGSRLSTNSIPVVVICGLFKMLQRPSGSSMEGFSRRSDSDPELVRAFPGFKIEVRAPLFLPPMNFQERVAQMAQ